MKDKYKNWHKLTGGEQISPATKRIDLIKMLSIPGIIDLEGKLLLNPPRNGNLVPSVEEYVDSVSLKIFGITATDTLFELPEGYEDEPEGTLEWFRVQSRLCDHEDQYATADSTDDEAVEILLMLGFDFRDDRGQPLRCTKFLCRQAEAAARGMMGTMPDRAEVGLEAWAKKLEQDAKQHMARKKQP
ncbi:hypothetical protein OIU34_09800 [Pararhizobium sp. BT-229]|uniref:hypothetical protein n=1 Tax=Pararhizobium sp. BT-229 TaxID=2986923 RepID=UPI0021F71394|nr:hypothetical protein [Pararhizobium sp. BT-229]MCV9962192.1 hypothetical protein [Pararhizobium sp. BT-229]